jgi:quinol monooxygenase YgiN
MFIAITFHHPHPQHRAELARFMRDVIDGLDGAAGLLAAEVCEAPDGSHFAGFTQWQSSGDFQRALPTILAFAPQRDPAWTTRPDEAIRLQAMPA